MISLSLCLPSSPSVSPSFSLPLSPSHLLSLLPSLSISLFLFLVSLSLRFLCFPPFRFFPSLYVPPFLSLFASCVSPLSLSLYLSIFYHGSPTDSLTALFLPSFLPVSPTD